MALKRMKTRFYASLMVSCVLFFSLPPSRLCAQPVSFKNDLLSVSFRDISLLEVARDIERQSGVWFRGDETLFQERVSVAFNDLPFEEGLKRILANLNYSLVFDAKNKVAGVVVMGQGKAAGTQPARPGAKPPRLTTSPAATTRPSPAVRSRSSASSSPPTTVRRPPRALPQPQTAPGAASTQPLGSSAVPSPLSDASDGPLPPAFRVMENAPPPPGAPASDKENPDASRVIRNVPPAGGTPQGAASGPGDSNPGSNAQAPGDASKNASTP